VALALLAVAAMTAPSGWGPRPTSLSHGGFTVVALLAGVVVLALEHGPTTSWLVRALAARPLAWLGKWRWPPRPTTWSNAPSSAAAGPPRGRTG
jgi:peptidoglycan/LPS O-acetylase OafA/YrhL